MTGGFEGKEPKLLDRLRTTIRTRHYSRSTEKAYVSWGQAIHLLSREAPS